MAKHILIKFQAYIKGILRKKNAYPFFYNNHILYRKGKLDEKKIQMFKSIGITFTN